jgi:Fungal specific transcription factor domain
MLDDLGNGLVHYGLRSGTPSFHPPRDICFQTNIQDEACIDVMISYAASYLSHLFALPWAAALVAIYRAKAIQGINQRLKDNRCLADTTLAAVIALIATTCEARAKYASSAEIVEMQLHLRGLRALIAARGGIAVGLTSLSLSWQVHW